MIYNKEADAMAFAAEMAEKNPNWRVYLGHQVNAMGVMGGGIALAIKQKYPYVYDIYRCYCGGKDGGYREASDILGKVCYVLETDGVTIANLFGQYAYGRDTRYTDYDGLRKALQDLHNNAGAVGKSIVVLPCYIGCGLAGGDWAVVEPMIHEIFSDNKVDLYICKLPE